MSKAPRYLRRPISKVESLSRVLGVPAAELLHVANESEKYYFANSPIVKPDGSERYTYRVANRLSKIQQAINKVIFGAVFFPEYLHGSIKDKENPRTYISAAKVHAGARLIISEDVSNFFGCIGEDLVKKMWLYLFNFSPEVGELLTRLTTYAGIVPQGAPTSSYIANLILWDKEPEFVEKLNGLGMEYTRYVDDIVISSTTMVSDPDKKGAISGVFSMLSSKGLRPNRRKHKVMSGSNRMEVHNITLNSGRITMSRAKRKRIRLEVFNLKKSAIECSRRGCEYVSSYNSIMGKVRELEKFHPEEAEAYFSDMEDIIPLKNK